MNNLSRDEQVVVNFEDQQAIGKAQGLLAGYPGTLAVDWCYMKSVLVLKEMCRRNKDARKKQTISHTSGSKPISRKRHEIFLETGSKISRGEMYIKTHTKKDGSFVTDEARDIAVSCTFWNKLKYLMTQNEKDESGPSTNDAIGKVFGEKHSGKVRCMRMGATPTNTFRNANHPSQLVNSSTSMSSTTNYSQADFKRLESKFDGTLAAFKAYFLAKEGRIPIELTGIFDHGVQANDVENETITPTTGRTSSGGSNENREDIV
ncbi:uncharacterized protein LOC130966748 [Arachis stenosperma]|uniref:uncharacterized protein LOC130966748 n=1 Tax=Arachis stenosperma TaxID=217475 RepID=UPI0025AD5B38|nr:uncharacterized protein LOC130966748 [Arachis stenosperma]